MKETTSASAIFNLLNADIEQYLEHSNPELSLFEMYFQFYRGLKSQVGSSSGFTGLSEYLFVRFILRKLEQSTGESFQIERKTKDVSVFRSETLLLTHDIDVATYVKIPKKRPDIAIFKIEANNEYHLLAYYEIKIWFNGHKELTSTIQEFTQLLHQTDAFLCLILFGTRERYVQEFAEFAATYPGRVGILSQVPNLGCRLSLQDSLRKVVSRLNAPQNSDYRCP